MRKNISTGFMAIAAALLIQGCAGSVSTMVKESNKDSRGAFDGNYLAAVDHPGGRQEMGNNWSVKCNARKFTAPLSVKDSKVAMQWGKDSALEGYIDSNGKFRMELPLSSEEEVKGNGTVMADGSLTIIVQGVLEEDSMKGHLVYGVGQFKGRGCSFPIAFSKS